MELRKYGDKEEIKGNDYITMNIFTRIKGFFMSLFQRFGIERFEDLHISELLSAEMQEHINLWLSMAQGKAYWNEEYKPSGVIPSIVGAISDPVSEEIKIESKNEKLSEIMNELDSHSAELVSNLVTCGSSLIRPIFSNGAVRFEIIKLGYYIPTSYDLDGRITGAVICKNIVENKKTFLLLEKHNFSNKIHSVIMELYRTEAGNFWKTNLKDCEKTKDLTESYIWENVEKPFIVEIRNPRANEIDYSNVPCALYAGHENLIEDCDRQYQEINIEQINGRSVLFADEDMFRTRQDSNGKKKKVFLSEALNRMIIKLNGNGTAEEKIHEHSPTLRTAQQIEAYQQILREIENVCRIGKGTLSNLQEAPQTATQFKGGKTVLYNTVNVIESEFEKKYKELAYIFAYMLSAYESVSFNPEITITYDESDRKDPALQRQEDLQEVNAGIMSKEEYRMKHYGETLEEARANLPEEKTDNFMMGV